jgi:hypothetical protein
MNNQMERKCNEAFTGELSEGFFVNSLFNDALSRLNNIAPYYWMIMNGEL